MGHWENLFIWNNNPFAKHIVFFGRYIDDIVVIWDGSPSQIDDFVAHCNTNDLGLSFTAVWNRDSLAFLDLELNHEGDHIFSRNYTKATAGNSYLHYDSCHHPLWKNNIPKGQFCRLRQNCTRTCDYVTQSTHLKNKFLEKGYPTSLIEQAYNQYLPGKKPKITKPPEEPEVRFITGFHSQHRKMEHILSKHWNTLKQDPHLNTSLHQRPKVTYRRAPTLKNKIAPSKLKCKTKDNSLCLIPLVGMYRCNKPLCLTCGFVNHGQKSFTHKGRLFTFDKFHNCSSD